MKHIWSRALQTNLRTSTTDRYLHARLALEELDEFEQRDVNEFFAAASAGLASLDRDSPSQAETQQLERDLQIASEVMARLIERYRAVFTAQARNLA